MKIDVFGELFSVMQDLELLQKSGVKSHQGQRLLGGGRGIKGGACM